MPFDLLQRMKHVLTWAAIVSVTSASTRSRTALFDQSVPTEQYTDTWVVQLLLPQSQLTLEAHTLAAKHGLINQGQVGNLDDYFAFKLPETDQRGNLHLTGTGQKNHISQALSNEPNVGSVQQQIARKRFKKDYSYPSDPNFSKQWSLVNRGQTSGRKGLDINVEPVWLQGITGSGVVVSIMDDGLEITHPDISPNYDFNASWDFAHDDNDPTPTKYYGDEPDRHGTSCGGEIAMAKDNNQCGVGVAYNSNLGCLKVDLASVTDSIEASSLGYKNNYIQVYSNSWGPSDKGFVVEKPGILLENALKNAVKKGRDGKGSIFVWAAGNGGWNYDSCAADGYSSSIYTIAVGSADQTAGQASYDEQCAGKMAVTYSFNSRTFSDDGSYDPFDQIYTTTLNGECTDDFTGTSASAPLVSGVITLALQANHELTWRDVQYLLVYTSNTDPLTDGEWTVNGAGRKISLKFGFGAIDAEAFVTRARNWTTVPPQISQTLTSHQTYGSARFGQPFTMQFTVPNTASGVHFLEHVVLTASLRIEYVRRYTITDYYTFITYEAIDDASVKRWLLDPHPRRGDIMIELTSPQGTTSTLLPYRNYDFVNSDDEGYAYHLWPFMSVHYWGENPVGTWTMTVTFKSSSGYVSVSDVDLALYGTSSTPQAVANIPMVCDEACARGCYGDGPNACDVCKDFRIVSTLECVTTCPNNMLVYRGSYCNGTKTVLPLVAITSKNITVSSNSLVNVAIAVGTSMGLVGLLVLVCMVVTCIAVYMWRKKKNEQGNRLRYHVLQSKDDTSSVPV
ncbi:neuroendocrine convertase 2-like isoform X2 [Halichondria panicea]|uniref:neuroendocrine convertase 2-like isoform X2 n=1 Tax=Halichondria panicea TaxID=6063 RepID=UPI00312B36B3